MIYKDSPTCEAPDSLAARHSPLGPCLTGLPLDLLQNLYGYCTIRDRLALARTCSYLHDIHKSSKLLQYQFVLETSAYLDVPPLPTARGRTSHSPGSEESDLDSDAETSLTEATTRKRTEPVPSVKIISNEFEKPTVATTHRRPITASSPPLDKMLALKERERRWETMSPAGTQLIHVAGPAGVYELQEGIFLMCDDYSDRDEGRPMTIRLIQLPSASAIGSFTAKDAVRSHKFNFGIADLTMDPTQDLVVVSEPQYPGPNADNRTPTHRYHLLTLSSFKPHPLATMPTVDFPPFAGQPMQTKQLLQVMDDTLVVLVSHFATQWLLQGLGAILPVGESNIEEEIVCWNWKTGKVMARMHLPENSWFASFALLTPTTFMITSTSNISPIMPQGNAADVANFAFPPVIRIYSFAPDPDNRITPVQPLAPDHEDDTTPRPVLLAQLDMPRLAPSVGVSSFDVRPDPPFPRSRHTGVGPRKAFTQDPDKGVLVFELKLREPVGPDFGNGHMEHQDYEVFVLRETLIDLAYEGEKRLEEQRRSKDQDTGEYAFWRVEKNVPWVEWGVQGSRIMDISMRRRNWVCTCSGYRFIMLVPRGLDGEDHDLDHHDLIPAVPRKSDFKLYDFSPWNLRRPLSPESDDADVEVTLRTAPTVLPRGRMWQEDVTTCLPYTEIFRKVGARTNGIMIDDQRIISVWTRGRRNGDWSNIRQEMTVYCM